MIPIERPVRYAEGQQPPDYAPLSYAQLAALAWHLDQSKSDEEKFCKFMGVGSLEEMTVGQFPKAIEAINRKVEKMNKGKSA